MNTRFDIIFILTAVLILPFSGIHAGAEQTSSQTAEPASEKRDASDAGFRAWAKEDLKGPGNWHYYWIDGLRIDSPEQHFTVKLNAAIFIDAGDVNPDAALETAFPDFEGTKVDLRRAQARKPASDASLFSEAGSAV